MVVFGYAVLLLYGYCVIIYHYTQSLPSLTFITRVMQSKPPSAKQSTSSGAASGSTVGCQICRKTMEQTQFSNSQRKRLKKGMPATCKACRGSAGTSGAGNSVSASADLAKAVVNTECSQADGLPKAREPIWESPGWLLSKEKVRAVAHLL